jgi:hypothetical protein
MFQVLGELVDAGRIASDELSTLDALIRFADPTLLRLRPELRPGCVPPIRERAAGDYVRDEWAEAVSCDSSALLQPVDEPWVVLAERTRLRWLDWEKATEMRIGVRVPGSVVPLEDADVKLEALCPTSTNLLVREYLDTPPADTRPVVYHDGFRFHTPGSRWLAFNPGLALRLGWTFDPDGLFRWRDQEGRVAAETVSWEDGSLWVAPPQHKDEAGYGYLVRVSTSALTQVEAELGPLVTVLRVYRETDKQAQRSAVLRIVGGR